MEPGTALGPQAVAHRVPEVRVDLTTVLDFLRRAGDGDRRRHEDALGVPDEDRVEGVILVTLEHSKTWPVGGAVHRGRLVRIDGPPVLRHDRVPHPPAHAAGAAAVPRLTNALGDTGSEELDVLGRLHHARGDLVDPGDEDWGGVGVSGAGDDPLRRESRQGRGHLHPNLLECLLGNGDQVARHERGNAGGAILVVRFQNEHRGRDGIGHACRDPCTCLPPQRHRPVGGDAHRGRACAERGGGDAGLEDGRAEKQHGQEKARHLGEQRQD